MNRTLRVLHVEDSERDMALLTRHLTRAGYALTSDRVETPEGMRAALSAREWDVILCDYSMPHFNAIRALEQLKETGLDIPFIIISGTVGEAVAVEAMRAGANDYLMKDNLARLAPTIERELHEAENRRARRQAEEALKASEAELRALFAAMTDVIFVLDAEGRYIRIAPTSPTYLYEPSAVLMGKTLHEVFPEEQADYFLGHIRRALDEGQMHRVEYSMQIGGAEVWFDGSVSPMSKDSVVWIARDITERKRAEEALLETARSKAESLALLDTILASAPIGFAFHNRELVFERINETLAAIYGLPVEQHIGRTLRDVLPEMAALIEPIFRLVLETGKPVINVELSGETPSDPGQLRYWLASFYPVRTKGDEVLGVGVLISEITERKRAEEALRESEERYKGLIDSAFDGVVIHQNSIIVSVNRAYAEMFGYTVEELIGLDVLELIPPEHRDFVSSHIRRDGSLYETVGLRKDGTHINIEASAKECLYEGAPARLAAVRDITERKTLEERLRQSQKMEAVGQLAGGVAHDFNNLLTAITGYSDLALRRLKAEDPLRQHIEEVKKAGERAAALTRQLLAFSRKQVLQPVVIDLNAVVSEMEKMLRRLIGEDVEFLTALAPELGSIKADPGQIEQVLLNLCVNARDAMPGGGKLTVETASVYLDEEYASHHVGVESGPYVMLAVSDTGYGMDEETQAHIFEPFFTTKETGKGTGLGLSTVYGIVQQSGGSVWVYSEVGRGTTFKVYLPRADEGAQEYRRSASPEEAARGTETILLAEDDEMVRRLAREVLEMYGYRVLEAANGGAALLICERHAGPIDLLLTDAVMPEMSGRELSERLSRLRPGMKVLYMSGYADTAVVHQGVLDEWANFLQKPFTPDALTRKVREILDAPPESYSGSQ